MNPTGSRIGCLLASIPFTLSIALPRIEPAPSQSTSSFRGLGDLPGGESFSEVSGIAADGSTVVGWSASKDAAPGERQAYAWNAKDGMVPLPGPDARAGVPVPFLENAGGNGGGNAGAASRDGRIVVGDSRGKTGPEAVFWDGDRKRHALPDLGGDGRFSTARGISDDGRFIVGCGTSPRGFEAFLWEEGKGMTPLGDAPGGAFNSSAQTVDHEGTVIFGSASVERGVNAFRWTREGGMKVLGDLPGGGEFSEPYAATPDGRVAVGRAQSTNSGSERFEGFRWSLDRAENGLEALGDFDGGEFESWALGVSGDGKIVVGFGTTSQGQEAAIWTPEAGMQRLADRIAKDAGANPKGWTLTCAAAISEDGRTIAGHGRDPNGNTQAWIWQSPPPSQK